MDNDKTIAASLIDAEYSGDTNNVFTNRTRYRLRAVRDLSGKVKVKSHKPVGPIHIYTDQSLFEESWKKGIKIGVVNW